MFRELTEVRVPEAAAGAMVSGCAAIATTISDVTREIFGVPLPVLMAAIAGAFVVVAFAEVDWKKAAAIFLGLVIAGCAGSPLLEAATLLAAHKFGYELVVTGGFKAFAAIAISAAPYWVPKALELWKEWRKPGGAT